MRNRIARLTAAAGRVWRHAWTHRLRVWAAVLLVSLTGVVIGTMLFAQSQIAVGPFRADMSISPSIEGGSEIDIPPLGSLHLDSHDGPIHLKVDLGSLDQQRTEALIDDPTAISAAGQSAVDDVTKGVLQLGLRALGAAIVCALVLSALIFRNIRRVASAGVLALVVTGGSLGLAAGTVRPDSISEPRYEGLLVNAPAVVGDARRIADNYGRYADQLAELVSNVSRIYTTVSTLPVEPSGNTTRILHVSDLHLNPTSWNVIRTVIKSWDIDAVVDTGDIVDWGSSAETSYVNAIGQLGVPYIYVRGNHDSTAIQAAVARQRNATVLDNSMTTINGLTIAGIGDPEFTPDKSETPPAATADDPGGNLLLTSGQRLATTIAQSNTKVGVALVHDPAMAPPLSGVVPVVLAGHTHKREVSILAPPSPPADGASPSPAPAPSDPAAPPPLETRLLIEGSTGGAGLRGLEKDEPTPLQLSVLYFDENQTLKAYDDIQLGGTGQSNVEMQRKVVGTEPEPTTNPSVFNGVTPAITPGR
ncbi:metallophosphoesterase [Pseudosporangium ferrugineum]|uniref:Calcineurin-like phosphoesterase family protein n=1 Tax=Pseudosporangium ferrugineum TaxID=439699 RepID=A0A2T0SD08_9ACTN|nr:metallophosphoesterase [Pseudosporangium ferrugineum]PRY31298.1 calcineurin-like phosphoesterase family protein [Pseudosporangium ferrugineum]